MQQRYRRVNGSQVQHSQHEQSTKMEAAEEKQASSGPAEPLDVVYCPGAHCRRIESRVSIG